MRRAFVLIAGLAALAWPAPAEACSCTGSAPSPTAFRGADLVFVGTVTRVDGPKPSRVNPDGSVSIGFGHEAPVTTFEIARAFKGASARELTIAGDGTNCDIRFTPGESWLVYAWSRDGRVTTHKCTRTRVRAEAVEDLAYLEGRELGRRQGIVYGDVHRRILAADGSPGLRALFEPLQVIAAGGGRRFTVTTDTWGPYQLVLPPGEFEIWVERGGRAVAARQSVQIEHGSERRLMLVAEFTESAGAQQSARDTPALALQRAEALWRAHGPASYQYGIILTCFCAPKGMDFRVVGGQPQLPPSATATTKQFQEGFGTIERLFARIRRAIGEGGHQVDVKYHAELGYPIWADLDPRREVKDDELFIRVTGFRAVKEPTGARSAEGPTEQSTQRTLAPTPLEAFVAQPGARTAWSKFIRRLDGGSASAIVTAIASTSATTPQRVMRGVRIELRHEGARPDCDLTHVEWAVMCARENAAIYIEEDRLASIREALQEGSAEVRPGHPAGITRFGGGAGSGTLIAGYLLYNVTLDEVSAALAEAATQLKTAPRQARP